MTPEQRKVKKMRERMNKMRDDYNEACKAAFPVGTEVSYAHGENLRHGHVVDVGYGHRMQIETPVGAKPWIDTYRFIDELV